MDRRLLINGSGRRWSRIAWVSSLTLDGLGSNNSQFLKAALWIPRMGTQSQMSDF